MSTRLLSLWMTLFVLLSACSRQQPAPAATTVFPSPPAQDATSTPAPAAPVGAMPDIYMPLAVHGGPAATPRPAATPQPADTPAAQPAYPPYSGPPLSNDQIGIQVHLEADYLDMIFSHLETLNAGWAKVQVSWKLYEPEPGRYDEGRFLILDDFVSRANAAEVKVLLGVAKAPEWSRPTTEMDGPPSDPQLFERFMRYLATRYEGSVAAYELWNEPNLQREWNGFPLSAESLVQLMRQGATGVRAADGEALLISAAPATTGINDGVIAIDDRVYLEQMLDHGAGDLVDGIGVHPYGWANPAQSSAADPASGVPTHNNHPSFFFADTLRDYRALLATAGHPELPLWGTEFGWGSAEGMGAPPPAGAGFMAHVSEWQQAEYTLDAFAVLGGDASAPYGPFFLWNLNFAPTLGSAFSESFYSVLRPDGSRRPVYYALQHARRR